MQIVTKENDLEGIEPPKSFRNAEDSVPYSVLEENAKLKFEAVVENVYKILWIFRFYVL